MAAGLSINTSTDGFEDKKKEVKNLLDYSAGQSGVINVCGFLFRNALGPYSTAGKVWIKKGVWIMRRK